MGEYIEIRCPMGRVYIGMDIEARLLQDEESRKSTYFVPPPENFRKRKTRASIKRSKMV